MKTWERTRFQNLIRHKSGDYYARAFAGGKEVWRSLKTSHFSVAESDMTFMKIKAPSCGRSERFQAAMKWDPPGGPAPSKIARIEQALSGGEFDPVHSNCQASHIGINTDTNR